MNTAPPNHTTRLVIKLVLVVALSSLGLVAIAALVSHQEPTYEGRGMSQYFEDLSSTATNEQRKKAIEAFSHFGTNAIPLLRKSFKVKDTRFRKALLWVGQKQSVICTHLRPAARTHQMALCAYQGLLRAVREGRAEPGLADACIGEIMTLTASSDKATVCGANVTLMRASYSKLQVKLYGPRPDPIFSEPATSTDQTIPRKNPAPFYHKPLYGPPVGDNPLIFP